MYILVFSSYHKLPYLSQTRLRRFLINTVLALFHLTWFLSHYSQFLAASRCIPQTTRLRSKTMCCLPAEQLFVFTHQRRKTGVINVTSRGLHLSNVRNRYPLLACLQGSFPSDPFSRSLERWFHIPSWSPQGAAFYSWKLQARS